MAWDGPTYRMVDGERIDGVWCHVWRRHDLGTKYYVDDLVVYADGSVSCGAEDLPGLKKHLDTGRLALTPPDAPVKLDERSKWESRWGEPRTQESFLLEVADRVEELNGRPTAARRCWDAAGRYAREPSEANRELLRAAYLAVPQHLRIYVLGDMDLLDRPLRILLTDVRTHVDGDGPLVTTEMHESGLEYFRRQAEAIAAAERQRAALHADDPVTAGRATVISHQTVYPRGRPAEPDLFVLRNDFPAPIAYDGETYPSVLHGYWALSAADPADRARIREAPAGRDAQELGGQVARRDGWTGLRLAVMAGLLRAKFTQHPELAAVLLGTEDARIGYTGYSDAPFWLHARDDRGRNWVGRLLELVRSELVLARET
ncbi:NADAR family protein [Streptomyces sp. NBC_00989]|uniref:NADAR family protein n=1 Tax=Streptomyces sp. NBC_00989 TaxID=2903705 RepID=UPI0038663009|nr:NADAR family protein [Streptomyces sp. NBC_00989]